MVSLGCLIFSTGKIGGLLAIIPARSFLYKKLFSRFFVMCDCRKINIYKEKILFSYLNTMPKFRACI